MTENPSSRYREIQASGPPLQIGQQIGEQLREEIRGFCACAFERTVNTIRVSRDQCDLIVEQSTRHAKDYRPDLIEELQGTAEAAGVAFKELMFLQIRNQLIGSDSGGCTSFSVPIGSGQTIVGQNWDNDPELDRFTVVLTRRPQGKPAYMSCTQAGLIAYIGLNENGIGACVNTLPAPSRPAGVPHYFTLRELFEANSLRGAVLAIDRASRAIPASIMLATPEGAANLEVLVDRVGVEQSDSGGPVVHTNHCTLPPNRRLAESHGDLIQSRARLNRITELVCLRTESVGQLKTYLADHDGYPTSICRHFNDDPEHGFWKTVFSIVMEPATGTMHVARGNPCESSFESYSLS